MKLSDSEIVIYAGEGIEIVPNAAHQMTNRTDLELEFLVISIPKSHGDKMIITQEEN